jgi:hypothetical protein
LYITNSYRKEIIMTKIISEDDVFEGCTGDGCEGCGAHSPKEAECSEEYLPSEEELALSPRIVPVEGGFGLLLPILTSDVLTDAQVIEVECADGEKRQVEVAHILLPPVLLISALDAMQQIAQQQKMQQPVIPVERDKDLWVPGSGDPGIPPKP